MFCIGFVQFHRSLQHSVPECDNLCTLRDDIPSTEVYEREKEEQDDSCARRNGHVGCRRNGHVRSGRVSSIGFVFIELSRVTRPERVSTLCKEAMAERLKHRGKKASVIGWFYKSNCWFYKSNCWFYKQRSLYILSSTFLGRRALVRGHYHRHASIRYVFLGASLNKHLDRVSVAVRSPALCVQFSRLSSWPDQASDGSGAHFKRFWR